MKIQEKNLKISSNNGKESTQNQNRLCVMHKETICIRLSVVYLGVTTLTLIISSFIKFLDRENKQSGTHHQEGGSLIK